MALVEINELDIQYKVGNNTLHAVDDVSFSINSGEMFGLVGESGCGKSTLAKSILRLLDENGMITNGEVKFNDRDLISISDREMRDVRWGDIAIIPQNAMGALNPVQRISDQIIEAIRKHEPSTPQSTAMSRTEDLLEKVGVDSERADDYPHEFSGGMRQRAIIAMALACDPSLIIADEPTTALDVIIQDEILDLFEELQSELGLSILIVSHDVGVISETCERVGVMYGGKLMEIGPTENVFRNPANPYTLGLKNSFPQDLGKDDKLISIPGEPPDLYEDQQGCRFRDRCPFAVEECHDSHPPLASVNREKWASACHRLDDIEDLRTNAQEVSTWEN